VFPSTPLITTPLNGATVGAVSSAANVTIAQANLPAVTLATSIVAGQGSHTHTVPAGGGLIRPEGSSTFDVANGATGTSGSATLPAMTGTTPLGGSGTAIPTVQPTAIAGLTFIKT